MDIRPLTRSSDFKRLRRLAPKPTSWRPVLNFLLKTALIVKIAADKKHGE
jgi:hypothetical protein